MNSVPVLQTNFTSGEISTSLKGRVDISKYFNAAELLENFIPFPEGGIQRRSGTKFSYEVNDSSKLAILKKFEYSTIQAYVLEFSDQSIRIFKDEEIVTSGGTPVVVSTSYLEAELRDLRFAQSADVLYIVHPNHPPRALTRTSDTSWSISNLELLDGPYLDTDTSDTELRLSSITNRATITSTANDFVSGDVGKYVEFTYQGTTLIGLITAFVSATQVTVEPKDNVVDPKTIDPKSVLSYAAASGGLPNRIRSTTTVWSTETQNAYVKVSSTWYLTSNHLAEDEEIPEVTGPPKEPAYSVDLIQVASTPTMVSTSGTLVFSGQTITATVTASSATFDSSRDVGRNLRLNLDSKQVWGTFTAVASSTSATLDLGRMVPLDPLEPDQYIAKAKTTSWKFGAWYIDNYPSVITFHEGRLNFFNTPLQPQTHWATEIEGYSPTFLDFSPTDVDSQVLDSSGITRTLDSGKINAILWAVTGPVLLIGTQGAEWQVKPESINEALTPLNYLAKEQTSLGSEAIPAERVGSSTIYIQLGGKIIREMLYSFELDSHVSSFLSILANHIFKNHGKVIDFAIQKTPYVRLWFVTDSGQVVSLSFEKEQEVVAFSRHIIGGFFGSGNAVVEAVETVRSSEGNDQVVFIVKRNINSGVKRYVEYLEKDYWPQENPDRLFMDSHKCFTPQASVAFTSITPNLIGSVSGPNGNRYIYSFTITFASSHGYSTGDVVRLKNSEYDYLNNLDYAVEAATSTTINLLKLSMAGSSGPFNTGVGGDYYEYSTDTTISSSVVAGTTQQVFNSFSGLLHLAGEDVQVYMDDAYAEDLTVTSGGEITTSNYGASVCVGYSYRSLLKSLPLEFSTREGSAATKTKKINRLTLGLLDTVGFKYGESTDDLKEVSFRDESDNMDEAPPEFSGLKEVTMSGRSTMQASYYIIQDSPYNLHVTHIIPGVSV